MESKGSNKKVSFKLTNRSSDFSFNNKDKQYIPLKDDNLILISSKNRSSRSLFENTETAKFTGENFHKKANVEVDKLPINSYKSNISTNSISSITNNLYVVCLFFNKSKGQKTISIKIENSLVPWNQYNLSLSEIELENEFLDLKDYSFSNKIKIIQEVIDLKSYFIEKRNEKEIIFTVSLNINLYSVKKFILEKIPVKQVTKEDINSYLLKYEENLIEIIKSEIFLSAAKLELNEKLSKIKEENSNLKKFYNCLNFN